MNLINELRMLAEDLHVNGYNRYSAAMSKAADELDKWEAVFGHLGGTPDECGNAIIAARDELEAAAKERGDLLEALKWMVLRTEEGGYPDGKCLEEARAAIAKATGEQK